MSRNSSPVHKRNFALTADTDGIIDLCSPIHTKPCRIQTSLISSNSNLSVPCMPHLKSSLATSLFQDHDTDGKYIPQSRENSCLTMEDGDDEYWEPAEYASHFQCADDKDIGCKGIGGISTANVSDINCVDSKRSKIPNNFESVIDLCSPASSKHSPMQPSASQFASTSSNALDRTLHSSDEEGSEVEARGDESDSTSTSLAPEVFVQEREVEERTYTSLSDRLAARKAFQSSSQLQHAEHVVDTVSVHSTSSHTSSVSRVRSPPLSLFSQVMRDASSLQNYSNTFSSSYAVKSTSSSQTVQVATHSHISTSSTTTNITGELTKCSSLRSKFLAVEKHVLGRNISATTSAVTNTATTASASTTAPTNQEVIQLDEEPEEDVQSYRPKPFLPSDFSVPQSALCASTQPSANNTSSTVEKEKAASAGNYASKAASVPSAPKASISSILRRAESVNMVQTSNHAVTKSSALYRASSVGSATLTSSAAHQTTQFTSKTHTHSSTVTSSTSSAVTNSDGTFRSRYSEKSLGALPALPPDCHWQVLLLIDKRERCNELIQTNMAARSIPCQLATLAVGDFLWVVRPVTATGVPATLASVTSTSATLTSSNSTTTTADLMATTTSTSTASILTGDNNDNNPTRKGSKTTKPTQATKSRSKTASATTVESQIYNNDEDTQMSAVSTMGADEEENNEISDPAVTTRTYVLDCIAERKSIADLASSMCDGRYNEQKARLKACNLRSTMYIVEGEHIVVSQHQKAISSAHIKTAMISINVDSGMHVLRTRSMDHTIICLQNLHRQVERRFQKQLAEGVHQYQTFGEFQAMYGKKAAATNRQLFGHQLRQIQGCSTSVAMTLMNKYGTTARFMDELKMLGWTKAQYTLENIVNEVTKRRLGKAVATRICQIYLTSF